MISNNKTFPRQKTWRCIGQQLILLIAGALMFSACDKFVEVDPPKNQLSTEKVFRDSLSATSAILGIYSSMLSGAGSGYGKLPLLTGMYSDEFNTNLTSIDFLTNTILVDNSDNATVWQFHYTNIYNANAIIEGLTMSKGISTAAKNQLLGEARLIRAWSYFHLVNLWGEVPLVLTTDYQVNARMPRTGKDSVINQVIEDLLLAKDLLVEAYINAEKTRPNKSVATALLARVYLYKKEWSKAEIQAQEIISSQQYTPLPALADAFLKGSKETIWQLAAVNPSWNTPEGNTMIPSSATIVPFYSITDTLYAAFEATDQRKIAWLGSNLRAGKRYYYANKYKVRVTSGGSAPTEYPIIVRMAEIYLIHAEASAQQDKRDQAVTDLNIIRLRAGLTGISGTPNQAALLAAVEQERRVELFAEAGHRWFDLRRTPSLTTPGLSRADDLLSIYKSRFWEPTDTLWPIPNAQRLVNNALSQNQGYN